MTAQTSTLSTETLYEVLDLENRIATETDRDSKLRLVGHHNLVMTLMTEADKERYEDFKASSDRLTEAEYAALRTALGA